MADHTDPKPKPHRIAAPKAAWAISSTIDVPPLLLSPSLSLEDALLNRRSCRRCVPADLASVLSLIRFAMAKRQVGSGPNLGRLRKISMSAGALHPIEAVVVGGPEVLQPIIYLDDKDAFGVMEFNSSQQAVSALDELAQFLPDASGHYVLLVANVQHVSQAYNSPHSLLWRDAGAVMQTLALLAVANGMSFIPLGSVGQRMMDCLRTPHGDYLAVGTGIIGATEVRPDVAAT